MNRPTAPPTEACPITTMTATRTTTTIRIIIGGAIDPNTQVVILPELYFTKLRLVCHRMLHGSGLELQ